MARKGEASTGPVTIGTEVFKEDFKSLGAGGLARKHGMDVRAVFRRRRAIEMQEGISLSSPDPRSTQSLPGRFDRHEAVRHDELMSGHVLVGSDAHYWPGIVTTAHRAFVEFCREYRPKIVIKNGDEADFPSISRHAPIAWEERPKISEEIDFCKAMLGEIEKASPQARHIHCLGNHDARFETRLATVAPEYANIHGVHLKDHFPAWEPCWMVMLNKSVIVKHRFKSGIYAPRNNTLNSGCSMVTGHLHRLQVAPLSDYNGTRFGVDAGTMADPYSAPFVHYTEMSPVDWRSGFVLLTLHNGALLWPEIIHVRGPGEVEFRGKVWNV